MDEILKQLEIKVQSLEQRVSELEIDNQKLRSEIKDLNDKVYYLKTGTIRGGGLQ